MTEDQFIARYFIEQVTVRRFTTRYIAMNPKIDLSAELRRYIAQTYLGRKRSKMLLLKESSEVAYFGANFALTVVHEYFRDRKFQVCS